MVGSIDPRCETVRGIHWPKPGRVVVWSSRRGNHLGQRSKPTASTGRTYGCKRSDQTRKNSCGTGAVHIWVPDRVRCAPLSGTREIVQLNFQTANSRYDSAFSRRDAPELCLYLSPITEGVGNAGCPL